MTSCPSTRTLEHFITHGLRDPDIRLHLGDCEVCAMLVTEMRANMRFFERLRTDAAARAGLGVDPRLGVETPTGSATGSRSGASSRGPRGDACAVAHPATPSNPRSVSPSEVISSSSPGDRTPPVPGNPIEGYELLSVIARGGQGVVYRAIQKTTKREVALKVLQDGGFATPRERHQFEREIEIAAGLRHPNIVTVHDSGLSGEGRPFFAMTYVPGIPLHRWWERLHADHPNVRPSVGIRRKLELFTKVCAAVSFAHQHGIIHRDLKPANILVERNDEPQVLDFGLAKAIDPDRSIALGQTTRPGGFVGTIQYAAPEQVRGNPREIDTRTDVYALGVILYEMLTGRTPYPVRGPLADVVHNITDVEPPRPSSLARGVDTELDAILLKVLSKDKDRRYQTADHLQGDIEHYLAGEPVDAKRDSAWYVLRKTARRYKLPVAVASGAALMLMVFLAVLLILVRQLTDDRQKLASALGNSRIEQGRTLVEAGDAGRAAQMLWSEFFNPPTGATQTDAPDHAPPGSRRVFWALWDLYRRHPCLSVVDQSSDAIIAAAVDPDGRWFASRDRGGTIRILDAKTNRLVTTLDTDGTTGARLGFDPRGRFLASSGERSPVRLWNVATWTPKPLPAVPAARPEDPPPTRFAFDPTGRWLALAGECPRIDCVSLDPSAIPATKSVRVDSATLGLDFSRTGRYLAALHRDRTAQILDLDTGRHIRSWRSTSPYGLNGPYFQSAGQSDALVFVDGHHLYRWDWRNNQPPLRWGKLIRAASSTGLDSRRRLLATAGEERRIRIFDIERRPLTDIPLSTLSGHTHSVYALAFLPDGTQLLSASGDGTLRLWETRPDRFTTTLPGHNGTAFALSFSPDGKTLATACHDRMIRLWDVTTARLVETLSGHTDGVTDLTFSPSGRFLASGGHQLNRQDVDCSIRVWDLENPDGARILGRESAWISSVAFSPDERFLATTSGGAQAPVKIWDLDSGNLLTRIPTQIQNGYPYAAEWQPGADSLRVAVCYAEGAVELYDLATPSAPRRIWRTVDHPEGVSDLRFDSTGRRLVCAGKDGMIRVHDADDGTITQTLSGHVGWVRSVDFSPDGAMVVSGGDDHAVKLWDVRSGDCLATFTHHQAPVFCVQFSPDGRLIASGSADGTPDNTVRLYDLTYYDRHIAGNLAYYAAAQPLSTTRPTRLEALQAWSRQVLNQPWPRFPWAKSPHPDTKAPG